MKIKYRDIRLSKANKERLEVINNIIITYQRQGYVLTLRQLYYQLVVANVVRNSDKEYKKLSGLLKEGRMAGIVDWEAIEDRLRRPNTPGSWESPQHILDAVGRQYRRDRQEGQPTYMEVWVEKDALSSVVSRVTNPYGIPVMVNRGYSSATAMHDAYKRFKEANENDQAVRVLYLGDHDPSGLDMVRDIRDRIIEFANGNFGGENYFSFEIIPIALTQAQIKKYNPPPNPAKMSDSRAAEYMDNHGSHSWEVDALPPEVLARMITTAVKKLLDEEIYNATLTREKIERQKLIDLAEDLDKDDN